MQPAGASVYAYLHVRVYPHVGMHAHIRARVPAHAHEHACPHTRVHEHVSVCLRTCGRVLSSPGPGGTTRGVFSRRLRLSARQSRGAPVSLRQPPRQALIRRGTGLVGPLLRPAPRAFSQQQHVGPRCGQVRRVRNADARRRVRARCRSPCTPLRPHKQHLPIGTAGTTRARD